MSNEISSLDENGIGHSYYLAMQKYKERVAQVDAITGEEQTYEELLHRSTAAAIAMESFGLKPGDFISICSVNYIDVWVPYFASLFAGVITAAVDPTMTPQEIEYLLNEVAPKIVFVGPKSVKLIEEVVVNLHFKPLIVVFGETKTHTSFSKFLNLSAFNEEFKPRKPASLDDTAVIHFSSGTTGRPKGICITHKSMLSFEPSISGGYLTILWFSSPYWSIFNVFAHVCVLSGMRRLLFPQFNCDHPWDILKFKIDFMFTNTLQALTFLNHQMPADVNVENLRLYSIGGHCMSKEQALKIYETFPKTLVTYGYGLTEVFGGVLAFSRDAKGQELQRKYPNSVGMPSKTVQWKVVDPETDRVLSSNELGELCIKTDTQCKGYHNRDSSEMFDSEGWLKTGDLVYYNEEKCFFVVNRIKDSFKYQAHHIIPHAIEDVLLTHPSIAEAVVVGKPHETDGNHPTAIIQLKENKTVAEEEIVKFVEERVPDKNRLRGGVKVVDRIPLTVTGKFRRFELRDKILNNLL